MARRRRGAGAGVGAGDGVRFAGGGRGGVCVATWTSIAPGPSASRWAPDRTSRGRAPLVGAGRATVRLYRNRETVGQPQKTGRSGCRARLPRRSGRGARGVVGRLAAVEAGARDLPELLRDVPVPGGLVAGCLAD